MNVSRFALIAAAAALVVQVCPDRCAGQRPQFPEVVATNRAQLRVLVASDMVGGLIKDAPLDYMVGFDTDVWINLQGRADSLAFLGPLSEHSYFSAQIVRNVWKQGMFDPNAGVGWRRWNLRFTVGELKPSGDELLSCPTEQALRSLLDRVLINRERKDVEGDPAYLEVRPSIPGQAHCDTVLASALQKMSEDTLRSAVVCIEGHCPVTHGRARRFRIERTELTWLSSSWDIWTSSGWWFVDCARSQCGADQYRVTR